MNIINLISGPRNLSTALMYSFAQRPDTIVIDEPFYAHYLISTNIDHPSREETINSMPSDINKVLEFIDSKKNYEIVFLKNMAHHHMNMDLSLLKKMTNLFLIRNPKQLIASFAQVIPNPTINDIGLQKSWELFEYVSKIQENTPIVLDSAEILNNPEKLLSKLCGLLKINFYEEMLSWPKGGIKEDGVWAKHWYKNVHNTTGFTRQKTSDRELPKNCEQLYFDALKYYDKLSLNSILI